MIARKSEGEATHQINRLRRLVEISRVLSSTLQVEPLLATIIGTAAELTDTEASSILLLESRSQKLRFAAASGAKRDQLKNIAVPLEGSIAGWVVRNGQRVILTEAGPDPRFYRHVDRSIGFSTRSLMAVPLKVGRNGKEHTIGALEVLNKRGEARFSDDDLDSLTALASQAAIAIENARLVADLQQAYAQLSQLDRRKSEFIAIASHELRTPLTIILAYASFLQEQTKDSTQENVKIVVESATRLQALIDNLTNLRYLETGQEPARLNPCDIKKLLTSVIPEFDALAASKGLGLQLRLPKDSPMVRCDAQKVQVVISNLVSNAIKFTPAGGQVMVTAARRGSDIHISVQDTGIGIPKEEHERIFQPFHQVEPVLTRNHSGMGLGLTIARGLVEQHGGRLWAESEPGKGSTFTFTLPLA
ncbi:MAG: GAF domain-containing sensor histidine kinase [Anaerolineae bacterium]|nr:GAF domain-containing sensor histidine kinase [Anaerolineae bacterium]